MDNSCDYIIKLGQIGRLVEQTQTALIEAKNIVDSLSEVDHHIAEGILNLLINKLQSTVQQVSSDKDTELSKGHNIYRARCCELCKYKGFFEGGWHSDREYENCNSCFQNICSKCDETILTHTVEVKFICKNCTK